MTLISPGDCTLQCGMWMMWLWNRDTEFTQVAAPCIVAGGSDDMPLNSPKRPPYWNSTPGFDFDHITAVDMSLCISVPNFTHRRQKKNNIMSIFKTADLSHLGF